MICVCAQDVVIRRCVEWADAALNGWIASGADEDYRCRVYTPRCSELQACVMVRPGCRAGSVL